MDFPMNLGTFNAYNTQPPKNSCSPIHHQINLISQHSHNLTTPHSFPLPTIICYFLYSVPGAHGLKAQTPLETNKPHGQYSQNNSFDDRAPPFHMEHKSYGPDDSEGHNAEQLFIGCQQEHQAQDSYFYLFFDIFPFPLDNKVWLPRYTSQELKQESV